MVAGAFVDPYGGYNFLVEIDGITRGAFQEVSGVEATVEAIEYRQGGENTTVRKLPGMTSFSNITLKWGITDDMELYRWHQDTVNGVPEFRKNGSIVLLDRQGSEVARWDFVRAWPTKYDGPELSAEGNEVAVETLELAHEGITRV